MQQQRVSICVFIVWLCVVVHGTSSNTVDIETPEWKTDRNRMVLQTNKILEPNQSKKIYENHYGKNDERNSDGIAPRYRYRNNKRERYYPKPLHKNKHIQKNRQKPNAQKPKNTLGRLLNQNEYPPNWTGGYYKYHQEGRASLPYVGATVNVPITRGNFRAQRSKIITSVIKPDDEWKYTDSSVSSPVRQSHNHPHPRVDSTYSNDDPRVHRRKHKKHCVMCPEERTLIANKKRDKVLFEAPKLRSCLGRPLHSKYMFKSIYGAKPGDLLTSGTHALVGEIQYLNKSLQICHLRVNVITKQCDQFDIPAYLKMDCDAGNNWGSECHFQCANPSYIIDGDSEIFCNDDLKWIGNVPNCKKKTNSCDIPMTDVHVQLLCNPADSNPNMMDNDAVEGSKMPEGSRCRIECDRGYRATPRSSSAVCIQGEWHGNLSVSCKRNRRKAQRSLKRSMKRRKIPFLHSDGIS